MSRRDSSERFRRGGEPKDEAGGPRFARLPVVLAALAGAALLVFLVLRYSAANALLELGPQMATAVSPGHPDAKLEAALDELRLTGETSERTEAEALAAFRRAPLSEVPLLIAARRAVVAGDEARADRLIAAASRRNPRSRYALLLQLDRQIRNGREAEAVATMGVLTRTFPDAGPLMTAQLAVMALSPDTRPAVRRVMALDPRLRAGVLEQLARQGADADIILALAGPPEAGTPDWQRLLLDKMVERGEVGRARDVWRRLSGAPASGTLYDPDFEGLAGPPPFNWELESSGEGFAQRGTRALRVEYSGREDTRLASQLLALAPGTYRLTFTAEGQTDAEGGEIAWTVSCHPGGPTGLEVPITGLDLSPKRFSSEFTVPASGCPGQWLRLVGDAAEFPEDQQVTIRDLRIVEAGR